MFSIWINRILSSLDGYSAYNTDFLALVKVLFTYIWRLLAKCSSSSFYSACGDRGLKQTKNIFSSKCPYQRRIQTASTFKMERFVIIANSFAPSWILQQSQIRPCMHILCLAKLKERGLFWEEQARIVRGEITPNSTQF